MPTGKDDIPAKRPGKGKKHVFSREVKNEGDSEWREWFLQVERRKKELNDQRRQPLVFSTHSDETGSRKIVRSKTEPVPVAKFLKIDAGKTGRSFNINMAMIESLWKNTVGAEIAAASAIYAFKNGVLTINIKSAPLLQEIRQFHQHAIFGDLHDVWSLPIPLVSIKYRLAKR